MNNNTFTIYKLKNYFIFKNEDGSFFKDVEKTDKVDSYTGSIDKIINRLEKDRGYNLRIDPTKRCILFGDLDHIPSEDIFNNFIQVLCKVFDVTKNKISYTSSIKPTEFSYHWSIPSIEASPRLLKKTLHKSKFDEFRSYIDLSIYDSHWFRLPNQTNSIKPIPHKIINGKMADFIVDYIENCDEVIDDEVVVEPSVKPKASIIDTNITDTINKCLQCIQADNYDVWMKVALIINNELGFNGLDVLDEWSKTGCNYNDVKVANFYKDIKPKDNGLKIGSLKKMAKEEDSELYKQLFSKKQTASPNNNTDGVFNDLEAAQKVYEKYPHWVCCDGTLYVFDDKSGLWTESEEVMFNIISRFNEFLYLLTINKNGEPVKTTKGYGNSTSLQRLMLPQMKSLSINNSWLTDTNLTSLNKILFKNGFYDMSTGIFTKQFDPKVVFFYRVQREYSIDVDHEYIKDVKQRIFYNQLGEVIGDYLILNLARSLAGNRMKKIFFGLGETNAGKSTYVNATTNTFGDYIGTFNGENLCIKNSTADEAQLMRWAYLLRYKRIIFSNEIKNESVLSGNMMKKVSSGGDTLVGRTHGCEEKPFIPHFNTFCNANDLLEIKPFDSAINDRLNIISYSKKYVINPSNEFELLMDPHLEVELKTNKFIEAFQTIIFDSYLTFYKNGRKEYIPDAVKNCKTEWVGEEAENTVIHKFIESFEITNDANHFTKSSDIEVWLKETKLNVSMTKFAIELKKYCSIKKYSNVESKNKKIAGKVPKVWIGIRLIIDDDELKSSGLDV
jgi:phage/plasmid-associated DNA primase